MLKFLKSHVITSIAVYGGAILFFAWALWFAFQYADPLPPDKVTIAAGSPNGAYYKYARQYARYFAEQGIELEILQTKGSMDNLGLISGESPEVDAAFMQGGITTPEAHPDLKSLGSLYYEPIWVFYNNKLKVRRLPDLHSRNIAIGPKGSGTNYVVRKILRENGIEKGNTSLINIPYSEALPKLRSGEIDAIFLIAGVKSRIIQALSKPGGNLKLFSFNRAEAYARSHHYLSRLMLPQGAINLAEDLPDRDVNLLAPTANLVVRDNLHPAIKYLFLTAASKVHDKGDVFAQPGQFPNEKALLFPLSSEAQNYFKKGPPLLMRYLPFQLAITLERLKILLIPLLTLLYPLFKITPPAYRWQIRRRIFKWYKDLKQLDLEAYGATTTEEANRLRKQLAELDHQVMDTSVPLSYTDYIYSLRIHIRLIQNQLDRHFGNDDPHTLV